MLADWNTEFQHLDLLVGWLNIAEWNANNEDATRHLTPPLRFTHYDDIAPLNVRRTTGYDFIPEYLGIGMAGANQNVWDRCFDVRMFPGKRCMSFRWLNYCVAWLASNCSYRNHYKIVWFFALWQLTWIIFYKFFLFLKAVEICVSMLNKSFSGDTNLFLNLNYSKNKSDFSNNILFWNRARNV